MTVNILTEDFKKKLEQRDEDEEVTVEQLKAEYALIQETRELVARLEGRTGRPDVVGKFQTIDEQLRWIQGSINHTIDDLENE